MYATWVAGPVLQITLLLFMFRRKLHGVFPRFFSYIIFQIVKSAILFVCISLLSGQLFRRILGGQRD